LFIVQDGGAIDNAFRIENNGTGASIAVVATGTTTQEVMNIVANALTTGRGYYINSTATTFTGRLIDVLHNANNGANVGYGVYITNDNASSTGNIPLFIQQDSTGKTINTNSGGGTPAHLTSTGTWTNASSTFADKENITELSLNGSATIALKGMKLYRYQKKADIYGPMEIEKDNDGNVKYHPNGKMKRNWKTGVINSNARYYDGLILDEPTTPAELLSDEGGIDNTLGVNFLLKVCKELIAKNEALEARVAVLEAA
jgi:hypothetical protein